MCFGKPLFSAPRRQIDAIKNGKFALSSIRILNTIDYKLREQLQHHFDKNPIELNNETTSLFDINSDNGGITTIDNIQKNCTPASAIIPSTPRLSLKSGDLISAALSLDLRLFPRPSRLNNNQFIDLKKTQISSQSLKLILLITAKNLGFDHYTIRYATKMQIAKAASRMIAYDNGFL